ncbi:Aste57867_17823 [Aphanomyces stellatus]|uniref:Aste57867_17823 protein n=1 Tax=Aphanomyces stellatus TaxID=120398 RepID=A0A485LAB4_9STRA|nr:hypothetical protein As57867_017762 [Aphanomyces stellatus]VFT94566.1 Aste57867_17823 [Aphanomyces stellatus]
MPSDFSPDRFADKLATCSETAASIQSLCGWILFHRRAIVEMVEVWFNSYTSHNHAHQIIHLYVANDVMQTGMRKFGREVPEAFSDKLLLAIAHSMTNGSQKIQEVIRKLVNVWRERQVLSDQVIDQMSDLCSTIVKSRKDALKDTMPLAKQATVATVKTPEEEEAFVLQDIPDAPDSDMTRNTVQKIEALEGEVISTDLLSDRMFQLSSNLNLFTQAQDDDGEMDWSQLDVPVFEIDLETSGDHVATFRNYLEAQLEKRTELIQHFKTLTNVRVLDDMAFIEIAARMDDEANDMQALFDLCVEAATAKEQKRKEYEAAAAAAAAPPPALYRRHSEMSASSSTASHRLEHRHSDSEIHHTNGFDPWAAHAPVPQEYAASSYYSYAPEDEPAPAAPYHDVWAAAPPAPMHSYESPRGGYDRRDRSRSRSRSRSRGRYSNRSEPRRRSEERGPRRRESRRSDSRERPRPSSRFQEPRYGQGGYDQGGGGYPGGTYQEPSPRVDYTYDNPPKRYRQY